MNAEPKTSIHELPNRAGNVPSRAQSDREERISEAIGELLVANEAGTADRSALLSKYKDVVDELAGCLDAFDFMNAVAPHLGPSPDAIKTRGETIQPLATLGDFRILQEIGRGGMGVVYEAEQLSLGRRVALKVLPFAAMLDKQQLSRFKNEARAAATLDHPNIVAIHSVGVERGVHYYAMQLIEGQSLAEVIAAMKKGSREQGAREKDREQQNGRTEERQTGTEDPTTDHCNSVAVRQSAIRKPQSEIDTRPIAHLSTLPDFSTREYYRAIARLGIQAAEALDHAHQHGILHRDIKPANLLLESNSPSPLRGGPGRGADGSDHLKLWITDFGLARIEQDAGLTMTGDLMGTLRYMSPEQALAKHVVVDHRSDIYSLGVTLYELLTLQPAYTADDRQELLRQIAFEEPRPPRKLDRHIPAELETIILKAIEKNPADRYETAHRLADDLRAYLDDHPIKAKPPTLWQRAAKWSDRHRAAVRSAIALLVLAVIGLAAATGLVWREQRKTADALAQANQKAAEVNAVVNFLVNDLLGAASPEKSLGRDLTVKEVLAKAETKIDSSFKDQPIIQAAIFKILGQTLRQMGQDSVAERHLGRAVELYNQHLGREHPDTLLAKIQFATSLASLGKFGEAEELCRETLEIQRRVLGPERLDTLKAMNTLSGILWDSGKLNDAKKILTETLDIERRVLGPDDRLTQISLANLSAFELNIGNVVEGRKLIEETLEFDRRVHGPDHPFTLLDMGNLAVAMVLQGKRDEQQILLSELLQRRRRVLGTEHPVTLGTMCALAENYSWLANETGSRELYDMAVQIRDFTPRVHGRPEVLVELAEVFWNLQKRDEAAALYNEVLQLQHDDSDAIIKPKSAIGAMAAIQGKWQQAIELWSPEMQMVVADNPEAALFCLQYGPALIRSGNFNGYERFRDEVAVKFANTDNVLIAERVSRACLFTPASDALLQKLNYLQNKLAGQAPPGKWDILALALLEYRRGHWSASLSWCEQSIANLASFGSNEPYREVMIQLLRAMNLHQLGERLPAVADLEHARRIMNAEYTPGQWSPLNSRWFDWEFACILRDEAVSLIGDDVKD